jgi:hypothetical protein
MEGQIEAGRRKEESAAESELVVHHVWVDVLGSRQGVMNLRAVHLNTAIHDVSWYIYPMTCMNPRDHRKVIPSQLE